jgi:integrase
VFDREVKSLQSFDRYVAAHGPRRGSLPLESLLRGWLARIPGRKPAAVANEIQPLRAFFVFRRRSHPGTFVPGDEWPRRTRHSRFVPRIFSVSEVKAALATAAALSGPKLRRRTFRLLILLIYCTGLRPGEAMRLRPSDVDLSRRVLLIRDSKKKTRLVPFRWDLAREVRRYVDARPPTALDSPLLVKANGKGYSRGLLEQLARLFATAGIKTTRGRPPRAYDLRHTFAVQRLTLWYRAGSDLHAKLPWLSAYLGHNDLLATEVYLRATPELLAEAGRRLERRVRGARGR